MKERANLVFPDECGPTAITKDDQGPRLGSGVDIGGPSVSRKTRGGTTGKERRKARWERGREGGCPDCPLPTQTLKEGNF